MNSRRPRAAELAGVVAAAWALAAMPAFGTLRQLDAEPVVGVWYRGSPRGVPNTDDLGELRALGFTTVVWPNSTPDLVLDIRRAAATVGLTVVVRRAAAWLSAETAAAGHAQLDVRVDRMDARDMPALAWRALAHGTRHIAFDAGEVAGPIWRSSSGMMAEWVEPARALARHWGFNAELFRTMGRARVLEPVESAARHVEIALFEAPRSWVIIATNTGTTRARGTAVLPPGVPAAPWADLFDGEVMAMLDAPGGARWSFDLPRGVARLFAIDK